MQEMMNSKRIALRQQGLGAGYASTYPGVYGGYPTGTRISVADILDIYTTGSPNRVQHLCGYTVLYANKGGRDESI